MLISSNTDIVFYFLNRLLEIIQSGSIVTLYTLLDTWIMKGAALNPCTFAGYFDLTLDGMYLLLKPIRDLSLIVMLLIFIVNALSIGILQIFTKPKDTFPQTFGRLLLTIPLIFFSIIIFWGPPATMRDGNLQFAHYEEDEQYIGGLFGIFDFFYYSIKEDLLATMETDDITGNITSSTIQMTSDIVTIDSNSLDKLQDTLSNVINFEATIALGVLIAPVKIIVVIICVILIVKDLCKLLMDIVKRYLLINVTSLFSSLAFSTYVSSNTSPILGAFMRLEIGQLLLHIISEFILFGFVMLVVNIPSSGLIGAITVISWLQIGLGLDRTIQALGVNAPAMSMNVLDEMGNSMMRFMMLDRFGQSAGGGLGKALLNKAASTGNIDLAKAGLRIQGKTASSGAALDEMAKAARNSGIRTASTESAILESYKNGNYRDASNGINYYYNASERDAACRNLMSSLYGDKLNTLPIGNSGINAFHDMTAYPDGSIKGQMDVYDAKNNLAGTTSFTMGPDVNPRSSTAIGVANGDASNRTSYIDFNNINTLDPGNQMVWDSSNGEYPCAAELLTGSLDASGMTPLQKNEFRQNCNYVETSQTGDVLYKDGNNSTIGVKTRNNSFYYKGQVSDNKALAQNLDLSNKLGYRTLEITNLPDGSKLLSGQKFLHKTGTYVESKDIMYNLCAHPEKARGGVLCEGGYSNGSWAVYSQDSNSYRNSAKTGTWKKQ